MKQKSIVSVVIALSFVLLPSALIPRTVLASDEMEQAEWSALSDLPRSGLTVPMRQGQWGVFADVRAAPDNAEPVVEFWTKNGNLKEGAEFRKIPHLVLYQNGGLTGAPEHTLVVEVSILSPLPPGGVEVTVEIRTQHGDPDKGGAPIDRIVWESEPQRVTRATATFTVEFDDTILSGVETPTDYFQYSVYVGDDPVPAYGPVDYAFLMENQLIRDLPDVSEESLGAAPDWLKIYYCDMFPFRAGVQRIDRVDVPVYVQTTFSDAVVEVFRTQTDDWGMGPWYSKWNSGRDGPDWLSIALNESNTYYHGVAQSDSGFAIRASGGWNVAYDNLIDGQMSTFHHEHFHNLQQNISLHLANHLYVGGIDGAWAFFSEGTAVLATSVGQPALQFSVADKYQYLSWANDFLREDLNQSYTNIANPAALYWRFLYEQCGGMEVISRSLTALYTPDIVDVRSDAIAQKMPAVMDRALEEASCSFLNPADTDHTPYEQSLLAFSRANYALRLENGRCDAPGTPVGCMYYDPHRKYFTPTLTYEIVYTGTEIPHSDQITSSFGMDFVDVVLDPATDLQPVEVEVYGAAGADAQFNVQIWKLTTGTVGLKRYPLHIIEPEVLMPDGNGHFVYTIDTIDTKQYNRLGLIITRIDSDEMDDPIGVYTVTVKPGDSIPPEIDYRVEVEPSSTPCSPWRYKVIGRDLHSGLGRLIVFDDKLGVRKSISLRVPPGAAWETIYSFTLSPGQSVDYAFVLTDLAGNSAALKLERTRSQRGDCGRPGYDHMDDSFSAASALLSPVELPPGARGRARVGVLEQGFFPQAGYLVELAGEPYSLVYEDFDPAATAARYPVLIIPSGGLYGMEGSASFRARLEEYARLGGVIVAFDQQHGYEYGALPGGQVGGYGWSEDISCSGASLMMESWHPLLSGLSRADVQAHVDGYFAPPPGGQWPEGTQVLLSRKANGRPAAILYPFPPPSSSPPMGGTEGGWVFATTMYDDWGAGQGQSYMDARTLLRDLLTWAIPNETLLPVGGGPVLSGAEGELEGELPQYAPGDPVTLAITMTNSTSYTATVATLHLIDPARQVALTRTVPVDIPPGAAASVPFTATAGAPLGIWRVEAALSAGSYPLVGKQQVARYVVAQPPAIVDPARPLYLSITAPDTVFHGDSNVPFTYHLYNYGSAPLTADVSFAIDHGGYSLLAEGVVVPAAAGETPGEATLTQILSVGSSFRLRGKAIAAGGYEAYASYGVRSERAQLYVHASVEPTDVQRSGATTLNLDVYSYGVPTATFEVDVIDAGRTAYHVDTFTRTLPAVGVTRTLVIPASVASGGGHVRVEAYTPDGRIAGGSYVYFVVPHSPLSFSLLPAYAGDGSTMVFPVRVENGSDALEVGSGVLTLTLTTPDGAVIPAAPVDFALAPDSSQVLDLPVAMGPLAFGAYTVTVDTVDEYGTRRDEMVWHTTPLAKGTLDAASYCARDEAHLDLRLVNPSPVSLPLTATLQSPSLQSPISPTPNPSPCNPTTKSPCR